MQKLFKKITVQKKLVISMGIMLLLLMIVSATSMLTSRYLVATTEEYYINVNQSLTIIDRIKFNSNIIGDNLLNKSASNDKAITQIKNDADFIIKNYPKSKISLALQNAVDDFMNSYNSVSKLINSNEKEKAIAEYNIHYSGKLKNLNDVLDNCSQTLQDNVDSFSAKIRNIKFIIVVTLIILTIISILSAIYLITIINKSIVDPIKNILDTTENMAIGNFAINISVDTDFDTKDEIIETSRTFIKMTNNIKNIIEALSNALEQMANSNFDIELQNTENFVGEYGKLSIALNSIIQNQSKTIAQIKDLSSDVTDTAQKLNDNAGTLIDNTYQQSNSVEDISNNIKNIKEDVINNTENAKNASKLAHEGMEKILSSYDDIMNMVRAMQNISEKSKSIAKIIKSIDNIAFQTNILALNAAIEASRAGEAGKGFAVVSEEVRQLAQLSANEATNINKLVLDSMQAVDNGSEFVNLTSESILNTAEIMETLVSHIDEITDVSVKQADAIKKIDSAVIDLSGVMDNNMKTSTNNTDNSQILSNKADLLDSMISSYKVKANNSYADRIMDISDDFDFNIIYNDYYDIADSEEIAKSNFEESTLTEDNYNIFESEKDTLDDIFSVNDDIYAENKNLTENISNLESDKYSDEIAQNNKDNIIYEDTDNINISIDNNTNSIPYSDSDENNIDTQNGIDSDSENIINNYDAFEQTVDTENTQKAKHTAETNDDTDILLKEEIKYLEEKNLLDNDE